MGKSFDEYTDEELYYLLCEEKSVAERAFSVLFTRHSPRIYAYCRRFLERKEDAQDVFQETFLRFHESVSKDRVMTNVPAFLLRIARNLCLNLKKFERSDLSFEDFMVADNSSEEKSEKIEQMDLIKEALETLPDEYKEPLILREYNGLTYNEISELTGQSLANVKVRIHRAKQRIKDILAPHLLEWNEK